MSSLLLAKILSTIFAVLGLSAIAERGGPSLAGILAGVPLGLAIIFFFIGIQQGPEFVAEAAPYALGGLAATLCLNLAYWRFSSLVLNYRFMTAVIAAISGFLIAAWAIAKLDLNALSGVALVAVCAVISVFAMRGVRATEIAARIPTTWIVVAMRAGLAVAVVLAVTEAAAVIGPQWSGLLAGFPVTLFPVLMIVHLNYSAEDTYSILKSFPFGIPSLVIFAVCAQYSFPAFGVVPGFLVSMVAALLWQVGLFAFNRLRSARLRVG